MNRIVCITFLLMATASLAAAPVDKDHLEKYGRGIIEDYSDMKEGEGIEWVWISPDVKLKEYKFKVKPFENMTVMADSDMEQVFEKTLPRTLDRVAGKG
ncbi:MAG TPA: hypothetical protein VM779_12770, partial [Thermoanaerobaculia bacterium]|nr:hypothetical protein [Thermoanaerobaculia bacterium]